MLPALKLDADTKRPPFQTYAHFKIGAGYATLSVILDEGQVRAGIAYCSPRDHWNKSKGRKISLGRRDMEKHRYAFNFQRNDKPLITQLRDEFEKHATKLTIIQPKTLGEARLGEAKQRPLGAPRWAYKIICRDIKAREKLVIVDNKEAVKPQHKKEPTRLQDLMKVDDNPFHRLTR